MLDFSGLLIAEQGNQNALKIAKKNGFEVIEYKLQNFADGSVEFEFAQNEKERVQNQKVMLFFEFYKPVNQYATIVLSLLQFLNQFAKQVVLIAPFMPFLRQKNHGPLNLFDSTKIITLDAHVQKSNVISLEPKFFAKYIADADFVILPDAGARTRYAHWLDDRFIFAIKTRDTGVILNIEKHQDLKTKKCLILDDIVDSGYTLQKTVQELRKLEVAEIGACITHNLHGFTKHWSWLENEGSEKNMQALSEVANFNPKHWGLDFLCISDTLINRDASNAITVIDSSVVFENLISILNED